MILSKLFITLSLFANIFESNKEITINHDYLDSHINLSVKHFEVEKEEYEKINTFNGETVDEIARKLNRYLNSTLKGKGEFIAKYSIEVGMDPYLATGVMLQETGCQWTCSYLTRVCNNVGGNKGKPGCNGGSYRKFNSSFFTNSF